jgi:molybdenum cofactor synthesis domain-containing protein
MRPFARTLPFSEALQIILEAAAPIVRTESVALTEADGRVAARDLVALIDVPPFDRAAMDGYAVVAADTTAATPQAPATLVCVDRVFTGQVPSRGIAPGECIEISTGAPMPPGADAVVMVEETLRDGGRVCVARPAAPRQHIGSRAADISAGQTVILSGQVLGPSRIGALAATGATRVDVYARPSVAILSTGNEIVAPGRPLGPGQIYDINRFTVEAVVRRHGGIAVPLATAADTLDDLAAAVDAGAAHDVMVFSGGSSVGERDLIIDAVRRRGTVIFHGIAVKPGKPTLFGHVGGTAVFGMPGYPTSCLSNAYMLLLPFVRKMARLPPWEPRTIDLPLARRITSVADRHQFYPVRVAGGRAEPAFKASGDITSMAHADGYIEVPAETEMVEAGTIVRVTLF